MGTPESQLRRLAISRRIVFLLVALAVIVPFLLTFKMPVTPGHLSRAVYDKIEALPPGAPVLLAFDYDPTSMAELYPMCLALLRHCFRRDLHPIVMTHWNSGVGLCKELVERSAAEAGKTPGKDFLFLGFKPGYANLVLNMGESLTGAFEKDYYGKPTRGMPVLEGIRSLKDIPLVIDIAAGGTVEMWIAYGRDRFGFDLAAGCTAVIAPDLYPFVDSGQLVGVLGGLRGAADYEALINNPGAGMGGMRAQSVTHVLIILLIVVANVLYALERKKARG